MKYSISATHGGQDKVSVPHNMRYNKYIKQAHIDPKGFHETWIHQDLDSAYKEVFGKARQKYNAEQKAKGRANRQIRDYRKHCRDSKQTNEVYEVIFTIGNRDNHPDEKTSRRVLREVVNEFQKRNPNFKITGAYYHADEPGAAPHVHVDYIPVARDCKRGMKIQNSLSGALKSQGYVTSHANDTAQMKWQKDVYNLVEDVCRQNGLDIERGVSKHEKRIDTELFKKKTELKELENEIAENQMWADNAANSVHKEKIKLSKLQSERVELETWLRVNNATLEENKKLKSEVRELKEEVSFLIKSINVLQRSFDFIKTMLKNFETREDGEKMSLWSVFKSRFFKSLGKKEYDDFQKIRHDPNLNEVYYQHERDYLDGTRSDAPSGWNYGR